jgi:acyl carrier protein
MTSETLPDSISTQATLREYDEVPDLAILLQEVKLMIVRVANLIQINPTEIRDDQPLFQDGLGLDSIDVLELAIEMDKTYGIKIKNDDAGHAILMNPKSIATAIARSRVNGPHATTPKRPG